MRRILFPIPALLLCFATIPSRAQTWEKINPSGVVAIDWLAVDGKDIVHIAGGGGMYWSADQGKTWTGGNAITAPVKIQYKGADATGNTRYAYVAHPDGDLFTLQIVIQGGKLVLTVFQSTDHGFNWANTMDTLPMSSPYATVNMLCAPNGHLLLFIANPGVLLNNLFVSSDKGKTWEKKGDLINHSACAVDPESMLYCAGYKAGGKKIALWRSKNDGADWDSLYADNGITYIGANQKGSVAVTTSAGVAAKFAGDAGFKEGGSSVASAATAIAVTPDNSVLLGAGYVGIQKLGKTLDAPAKLNGGLGTDTAATPRSFTYDSKGNLYLRTGQNIYLMRGTGSPVRRIAARTRKAALGAERDLEGRKVETARPARIWKVESPATRPD